ncbi:MAG TPA: hypothetical protein VFU71_03495 [Burkholderiaceae bacterium]|nr:hypothetical protein [Burkholderiaceae bacterium]
MLALLSAQWGTAAYACPRASAAASVPAAVPAMPDCHGTAPGAEMDPDQPLLCKAHCDQGSQTVNDVPAQQPTPQLLLLAVLDWNGPALNAAPGVAADDDSAGPSPASSPPLYLRLLVLRN